MQEIAFTPSELFIPRQIRLGRRTGMKRRRATKRTFKPRKRFKQRGFRRAGGITARRNVRIGGFLGIENKFYDTSLVSAALTAPANAESGEHNPSATITLNTITQGDGESQRDGRKATMHSLHIRGTVQMPNAVNQTAVSTPPNIFIAVVLDTQTNGTLLASENVFRNAGGSSVTATNILRNLQYTKRFKVLGTRKFTMRQGMPSWDGTNLEIGGDQKTFQFDIQLNGLQTTYTANTETIANIVDNSINLVAYSNSTATGPTISYTSRLRFSG